MKNILVIYYSRQGHTARMVRTIVEKLKELGNNAEIMPVAEALREGVDWDKMGFHPFRYSGCLWYLSSPCF